MKAYILVGRANGYDGNIFGVFDNEEKAEKQKKKEEKNDAISVKKLLTDPLEFVIEVWEIK